MGSKSMKIPRRQIRLVDDNEKRHLQINNPDVTIWMAEKDTSTLSSSLQKMRAALGQYSITEEEV